MTASPNQWPTDYASLKDRFAPILEEAAEGSVRRELERELPFDVVAKLDAAGFGALRVPREHGGPEVSIEVFTRLLVDLAEADSNVAHLYRSHAGFVEALRFQPQEVRDHWFPQVLEGATVGNASTERGGNVLGTLNTVLTRTPEGGVLNGEKYYTTGSIFSDYTRVSVSAGGQADGRGFVIVPVDGEGVSIQDDWDGFGQRLTGTGTATFEDVRVPAEAVLERVPGSPEAVHEAAFFQLVLLAVLAGIARAARRDAVATVAARKRTFNTGLGLPFREDPLVQEAVGRIAAKAEAAEAVVLRTARFLDEGLEAARAVGADRPEFVQDPDFAERIPAALVQSEIAVEHGQIVVPELALGAAQDLFLTVGASAVARTKALDRHWRNAQTVATHNPIAFRARALGDWWINGTVPVGLNAIGDAPAQRTSEEQEEQR